MGQHIQANFRCDCGELATAGQACPSCGAASTGLRPVEQAHGRTDLVMLQCLFPELPWQHTHDGASLAEVGQAWVRVTGPSNSPRLEVEARVGGIADQAKLTIEELRPWLHERLPKLVWAQTPPPACFPQPGAPLPARLYGAYNLGGPRERVGLSWDGRPCPTWSNLTYWAERNQPSASGVVAKWRAVVAALVDIDLGEGFTLRELAGRALLGEAQLLGSHADHAEEELAELIQAPVEGVDERELLQREGRVQRLGEHVDRLRAREQELLDLLEALLPNQDLEPLGDRAEALAALVERELRPLDEEAPCSSL